MQKLIDWNKNQNKKPLIVWGARQVGETYLIKDIFAETYYKNNIAKTISWFKTNDLFAHLQRLRGLLKFLILISVDFILCKVN